jgi:hypothetical protein
VAEARARLLIAFPRQFASDAVMAITTDVVRFLGVQVQPRYIPATDDWLQDGLGWLLEAVSNGCRVYLWH